MKASMTIRTEFSIKFSEFELTLLDAQSRRHYDGLCKSQAVDQKGMIALALHAAKENKGDAYFIEEFDGHVATVYWNMRQVDLACKILEFPMFQDESKNSAVHNLRSKLARIFRAGNEAYTEFGIRQIDLSDLER